MYIRETNKKDSEIKELDQNMVYVFMIRTLWCNLIHVADPTLWDKAWLLYISCMLDKQTEYNASKTKDIY